MVNTFQFVPLRQLLEEVTKHPMLKDVDIEAGITYAIKFFAHIGLPNIYEEKQACVEISKYRGELPCDLVAIIQVRDERTKVCLRSMTDSFNTASTTIPGGPSFKTQGRFIITSFESGTVRIAYKAIAVDEDGVPMVPDNPLFIEALTSYIKKERFLVLFDQGKLNERVLDRAEKDWCWAKARCKSEFLIPSESEMQTITGMMHRLIPSKHEFEAGYKGLGDRAIPRR